MKNQLGCRNLQEKLKKGIFLPKRKQRKERRSTVSYNGFE